MSHKFFLGYGSNCDRPRVALYQPVIGRFLFVLDDPELVTEIVYLTSSRYSLYPCDATAAKNYHHNIIDNTCCHNWAPANRQLFSLTTPYDVKTMPVDELVELGPATDPDLEKEQQWLQLVYFWVKFYTLAKKNYNWYDCLEFVQDVFGTDPNSDLQQLTSAINLIRRALYLGREIAPTQDQIQHVIDHNAYLRRRYQLYV